MADEMFFSPDSKSLRRGKRIAPRTETSRPCLVWPADAPEMQMRGVILDMNVYGMLIRMMESLPPGMRIQVQLMRDDAFRESLTKPVTAMVVRSIVQNDGLVELGIQVVQEAVHQGEDKPFRKPLQKPRLRQHGRTRMYTRHLRPSGVKQRERE